MFPQQPQQPAPAQPDPALAALDEAIDVGTIAANAQRDIEAETPPGAPGWQEVDADDEEDDEEEAEQPTPQVAAPEPPQPAEEAPAGEPEATAPRYSRRDAARFAAEAEQRRVERDEARAIVANAQREVEQMKAKDRHILTQLGEVSGYTRDQRSGRFVYELLAEKVLDGTATADERQAAIEMRQWHELAGPIYREAEQQVQRQYSGNWSQLGELEGIGPDNMAQLNTAPDAIAATRAVHSMALKAGEAKAAERYKQQIAKLEAENRSLRRNQLASSPQPATANGSPVPTGAGWRDRAFDANGLLTDDFEKEIRSGKWLGQDLASS